MSRRYVTDVTRIEGVGSVATIGVVDGLPAIGWGNAPREVLDTRRGLARRSLRPVGDPVAVLVFGHRSIRGRSVERCSLYRVADAVAKRAPAPGQMDGARRALRTCQHCGRVGDRYVARLSRMCVDCETTTDFYAEYAREQGYEWPEAA